MRYRRGPEGARAGKESSRSSRSFAPMGNNEMIKTPESVPMSGVSPGSSCLARSIRVKASSVGLEPAKRP